VREDGRIVAGEQWKERLCNGKEWKKLLRMARNLAFCKYYWNE
jgi:hypothetical protein